MSEDAPAPVPTGQARKRGREDRDADKHDGVPFSELPQESKDAILDLRKKRITSLRSVEIDWVLRARLGPVVVVDCSFEPLMSARIIHKLAHQLHITYGVTRQADWPARLVLSDITRDALLLKTIIATQRADSWRAHIACLPLRITLATLPGAPQQASISLKLGAPAPTKDDDVQNAENASDDKAEGVAPGACVEPDDPAKNELSLGLPPAPVVTATVPIVYLSADATTPLPPVFDPATVYLVGGLLDRNSCKGESLERARILADAWGVGGANGAAEVDGAEGADLDDAPDPKAAKAGTGEDVTPADTHKVAVNIVRAAETAVADVAPAVPHLTPASMSVRRFPIQEALTPEERMGLSPLTINHCVEILQAIHAINPPTSALARLRDEAAATRQAAAEASGIPASTPLPWTIGLAGKTVRGIRQGRSSQAGATSAATAAGLAAAGPDYVEDDVSYKTWKSTISLTDALAEVARQQKVLDAAAAEQRKDPIARSRLRQALRRADDARWAWDEKWAVWRSVLLAVVPLRRRTTAAKQAAVVFSKSNFGTPAASGPSVDNTEAAESQ